MSQSHDTLFQGFLFSTRSTLIFLLLIITVCILILINNNYLVNKKGERKINDAALTAITLLVAESKPSQKDVIVKLIVNLINKK